MEGRKKDRERESLYVRGGVRHPSCPGEEEEREFHKFVSGDVAPPHPCSCLEPRPHLRIGHKLTDNTKAQGTVVAWGLRVQVYLYTNGFREFTKVTGTESGHQPKDKSAAYSRARQPNWWTGLLKRAGKGDCPFSLPQSKARREREGKAKWRIVLLNPMPPC